MAPLYPVPNTLAGSPVILCESELDVLKLQAQDRTVRAVCMTGRVRSWPGQHRAKAWSRKRPRWYRRQMKRADGGA